MKKYFFPSRYFQHLRNNYFQHNLTKHCRMKSNAFIQYCSYWTKRSMKWPYHYTLMGDWRKMEVHFLVLFFTVSIAATDLMCAKISISSISLLCWGFGKLILLNRYKAYILPLFYSYLWHFCGARDAQKFRIAKQ